MEHYMMNLTLKVWRQSNLKNDGRFETYQVKDVSSEMSFLEMMDMLNDRLLLEGIDPIAFDHDCREGICGSCAMHINGRPHGPWHATTTCQLHMRAYKDGDTIVVEPWRAVAFPVIKDLVTDRGAFDRIIQAGGFISVNTGNAVDGNAIPVEKDKSDAAFGAASCISCGACVAACKNASASLFTAAKIAHLGLLPQGAPERKNRVLSMVAQMDKEGFGSCTFIGACEAVCPKEISITNISRMHRDYLTAGLSSEK
jgi:succinate dehydrogenase / fumarate reductase iron-sulfur subunit